MKRNAVSGIMLALLLVNMLTMVLNTLSINAIPVMIRERNNNSTASSDIVKPQEYSTERSSLQGVNLEDAAWNFRRYGSGSRNEYTSRSSWSAQRIGTPRSCLVPSYKLGIGRALEWKDYANADEDSAELVIGVNNIQQSNYYELADLLLESGAKLVDSVSMQDEIRAVVVDVPFSTLYSIISEVETTGLASYIEPNTSYEMDSVPNDPEWPRQWGPDKIGAEYAWNITTGSPSVLVAIIDTGVDWNHPDLAANYVPLGYDWVNNDPDPMDDNGHGTHVAGITAAVINNGIGIAGLAQARIMAEKGLDASGSGSWVDLAKAIIHAVDQGADILNLSWGGDEDSALLHDAIKYAFDRGVLIVGAAGNDAWSLKHYPAAYGEVLAVSAIDGFNKQAEWTSFGDWIEFAAPGVDIFSTLWDNSYGYKSGTSMAAPHVSGVAALTWSSFPNLTRDQVRIQLRRTAIDQGDPGFDEFFGYGRVNAKNAVEQALPDDDLLILEWNVTRWAKPEDPTTASVDLLNFGKSNQSNITVQLIANGDLVDSASIESLNSGASSTVNFTWKLPREGIYNATMYVVPVLGEEMVENNAISTNVLARTAKVILVPRDFQTIAEAIDIASSGFTIYVASGSYHEHLVLYKSLKLVGEQPATTIIDGGGIGTVIIAFSTSNISISGFTIQNSLKIWGISSFGVYLCCTNGSAISNSVIVNNNLGIYLDYSHANIITNNTILNNKGAGFVLSSSNSSNIISNKVEGNGAAGILLEYSANNTLRNNESNGNWLNFGVDGNRLPDFVNDVDFSNTVNGKPVYYWINQHDEQVPEDAGYVAIVNSTRIALRNLNLTNNDEGLIFAYTTESVVENVNASDNMWGVSLFHSDNNIVTDNSMKSNWFGIYVSNSSGGILSGNVIDSTEWFSQGIWLGYSSNNTVFRNRISNHKFGSIFIDDSSSNIFRENSITNDGFFGIGLFFKSKNNMIIENELVDNSRGIWLSAFGNNTIYHNNFVHNSIQVDPEISVNNTWDTGYPSGGNYWSDYTGVDVFGGLYQNITGSDGIVDSPHIIDASNQDRYPLTYPWSPLLGDINGDRKVDGKDIAIVAKAFASYPNHSRWNPRTDLNQDNKIDGKDIAIVARNFGKTHP